MKDWVGNSKSTFSTLGSSAHSAHDREANDYYATEPVAIDKLFGALGSELSASIWEPACGGGAFNSSYAGVATPPIC